MPELIDPYVYSNLQAAAAALQGQKIQNQQQQQQLQQLNMLKAALSAQDAIDPKTGRPTTNTLATVMKINPQIGLTMMKDVASANAEDVLAQQRTSDAQLARAQAGQDYLSTLLVDTNAAISGGQTDPKIALSQAGTKLKSYIDAESISPDEKAQQWGVFEPAFTNPDPKAALTELNQLSMTHEQRLQAAQQQRQADKPTVDFTPSGEPVSIRPDMNTGGLDVRDASGKPYRGPVEKAATPTDPQKLDLEKRAEALKEKIAQGGAAAMTDGDAAFAAQIYMDTGVMPSMGFGAAGAAAKAKILHKAADMATAQSGSPEAGGDAVVFRKEALAADKSALTMAERQTASIELNAPTVLNFLDRVDTLAQKVSAKFGPNAFNKSLVDFKAKFGSDPDAQALITDMEDVGPEQAKIMSGSTGSVAAATDAAAQRVEQMINYGMPLDTLEGAIHEIKQGIAWRRENAAGEVKAARAQIGGDLAGGSAGLKAVPSSAPPPAPPGGPTRVTSQTEWQALPKGGHYTLAGDPPGSYRTKP